MLGDHRRKKDEIWKRDKNILSQTLINLRIWFRAANRETKGMLPIMILLIIAMLVINLIPILTTAITPKPEQLPTCVTFCYHNI